MALTKIGKEGIANISNSSDATAITIDSSENVLVKKTATNYQTVGVEAKSTGQLWATADQNNPIIAVRKTNDGKIQTFYKDTTEAGSIGNAGARLFINSGNVGLNFAGDGSNQILPSNAGANRDDGITLGTTNVRFKDLYLSGGVFLGGTGSANALDDYEEGTWSPTHTGGAGSATLSDAKYTKIGRLVHIVFSITFGSGSGQMSVGNLPFTANSHSIGIGKEDNNNGYTVAGDLADNGTTIDLLGTQSIGSPTAYQVGTGRIRFSMTYFTD